MSKKLYKFYIGDFCLSVTSNEYEEEKVCIANILLRFRQRCNYEVIIGRIIVVHRWDGRGVIQYLHNTSQSVTQSLTSQDSDHKNAAEPKLFTIFVTSS